jgi:hypothetical protein
LHFFFCHSRQHLKRFAFSLETDICSQHGRGLKESNLRTVPNASGENVSEVNLKATTPGAHDRPAK